VSVAAQFTGKDVKDRAGIREELSKRLVTPEGRAELDGMLKQKLQPIVSKIIDSCIPGGQVKKFPGRQARLCCALCIHPFLPR
jgi:hypothetical protein